MNDNAKAASILRQYAGELYQGHTIGGEWGGEHIKAEHDELMALADRLATPPAAVAVPDEGTPLRKLGARLAQLLDEDQFAECEALLLAAPASPAATGWLAIETAPKDGTPVMLLYKSYIVEAVWKCVDSGDWEHGYGPSYWWESDLVMMDDGTEPTHWMPRSALPPAPSVDGEG